MAIASSLLQAKKKVSPILESLVKKYWWFWKNQPQFFFLLIPMKINQRNFAQKFMLKYIGEMPKSHQIIPFHLCSCSGPWTEFICALIATDSLPTFNLRFHHRAESEKRLENELVKKHIKFFCRRGYMKSLIFSMVNIHLFKTKGHQIYIRNLKSVNLQYNTLGPWVDGPNN